MGSTFAKQGLGKSDTPRSSAMLELKSKEKLARKSMLKRHNHFETQLTIINDFKASRAKNKSKEKRRLLNTPEKTSLATELYLRSLREKQIPLNILEAPVDSPRGRKRFEYDKAKLEKGDFVNFILADVQEQEEEDKPDAQNANHFYLLGDIKLQPSVNVHSDARSPSLFPHKDSLVSIQKPLDSDRKRRRSPRVGQASPRNHTSDDDSVEREDEYEIDAHGQYPNRLETLAERRTLENEFFANEGHIPTHNLERPEEFGLGRGETGFHPTHTIQSSESHQGLNLYKKEPALTLTSNKSRKRKDQLFRDDQSSRSPIKKPANYLEEQALEIQNSQEQRERLKSSQAVEKDLDPEARARLRILQAVHGERFNKNVHMSGNKEKKIIIESDDESEDEAIGGELGSTRVLSKNIHQEGNSYYVKANSPVHSPHYLKKREASQLIDSLPGTGNNTPAHGKTPIRSPEVTMHGSLRNSPLKKEPIIRLPNEDDDDGYDQAHRSKNTPPHKSRPSKSPISKNFPGSSRFSTYVSSNNLGT